MAERALRELKMPIVRVGARQVPIPSGSLRKYALPSLEGLLEAVCGTLDERRGQ